MVIYRIEAFFSFGRQVEMMGPVRNEVGRQVMHKSTYKKKISRKTNHIMPFAIHKFHQITPKNIKASTCMLLALTPPCTRAKTSVRAHTSRRARVSHASTFCDIISVSLGHTKVSVHGQENSH